MPKTLWQFGSFEYSRSDGLSRDGTKLSIQPKPRALLELLLRANGSPVSKHGISAALWPNEVPSDASIARAVASLRRVLGSESDIVRTRYGEGVQLTCAITERRETAATQTDFLERLLRTAWEMAEARTRQGFELAMGTLQDLMQPFPDAAAFWSLLADAHISRVFGNVLPPAEAANSVLACCEKALQRDPQCKPAIVASGLAVGLLQGDSDKGLKRLESGLEPTYWLGYYYRAWLHLRRRNLAAALADTEYALTFVPLNRTLHEMKAFIMLYQGRLDEAETYARDMQKQRDDSDGLWIVRSMIADERGDLVGSYRYAERATQIVDGSRQTATYLAHASARIGHTARARAILSYIGSGWSGHTPALLAAPYFALGDLDKARQILDVARAENCPFYAITWCDPRTKGLFSQAAA